MRFPGWTACALLLLALTGCDQSETVIVKQPTGTPTPIVASPTASPKPAKAFDFYVLALSWSPSYCEAEGAEANPQQCSSRRRYAFVVHGLWPQFERGFPKDCETDVDRVPDELVRSLYDIMPSAGLIGGQWRRHGSCTGLTQEGYFATLRAAREKIVVPTSYHELQTTESVDPKSVEKAFVDANPAMQADAISTSCDERYFREVRICLTKGLEFRSCASLEKRSCRAAKAIMPPVPSD